MKEVLTAEPMAFHALSFARGNGKAVVTFHVNNKGEYFVSPTELKMLWPIERTQYMPIKDFISFLEEIDETDLLEQIERHT